MNILDKALTYIWPQAVVPRLRARHVAAQYEAATPSRARKLARGGVAPNSLVGVSAKVLRDQARHLDRNHDITRGALDVIVNATLGQHGIGIEPAPKRKDGTVHTEYAAALLKWFEDWQRTPEVTHRLSWARTQRIALRTKLRDGECFAQVLAGPVPGLDHGTRVPLSLELIEPDLVPLDLDDTEKRIRQGVERNAWGRPTGYYVYRDHPDELYGVTRTKAVNDYKRIPAANMLHIASIDRIGQLRGVSALASVITRAEDIKDYEESERVAAKIAANLTGYVKKSIGDDVVSTAASDANPNEPRSIAMNAGMIIDDLRPGEEVGLIDSKRPNVNLLAFRQGQLRAYAAGVGASSSSISKDYEGSYSSKRQELVESYVNYGVMADDFVRDWVEPTWQWFVRVADLSGIVPMPPDLDRDTAMDALYIAQQVPWIDPLKEALGYKALVRAGFASEAEIIRKRGRNPEDVLNQIAMFRDKAADKGLVFDSDAKATSGSGNAQLAAFDDAANSGANDADSNNAADDSGNANARMRGALPPDPALQMALDAIVKSLVDEVVE